MSYQSSKYTAATSKSDAVVVEFVKGNELELVQTTRNTFKLNFRDAVESLAIADVNVDKIVVGANNANIKVNNLVKSVTLADDKKSATVVLYNDFVDATDYQITVKGFDMATMTASVGAPASIVLSSSRYGIVNTVVADGTSTEICARLYDANGIDITATETGNESLSFKITYTTGGYTYDGSTGKYLYFTTVGDSAVVEATYHSGKYDTQGNEIGKVVSAPFTFVGVDKSYVSVVGVTRYGLGGEWNGTTIKMNDKNTGKALGVKFKLADGNDSSYTLCGEEIKDKYGNSLNLGVLTFKSLNTDILEVKDGVVYPYKPGTTQVMAYGLKDGVETALAAVTIEVLNWTDLSTVNLSTNRVVISTGASANVPAPVITAYAKDQYGNGFGGFALTKIEGDSDVAKAAVSNSALIQGVDADGNPTITISDTELKSVKATYAPNEASMTFKFNLTFNNANYSKTIVSSLVVELRVDNANYTYDVEATGLKETNVARRVTTGDYNNDNEDAKFVKFSLYKMSNFAKVDTQDIQVDPRNMASVTGGVFYYKLTRNGNVITPDAIDTANGVITVNFTSVDSNGIVVKKNAAGTEDRGEGIYELTIYQGIGAGSWKAVASERVTVTYDTGAYSLTGRRAVEANSLADADLLACFGFKNKEGSEMSTQTPNNFSDNITRTYIITKNTNASSVNTIFVEKVTFYEEVAAGEKVAYEVWVNQAVKIK